MLRIPSGWPALVFDATLLILFSVHHSAFARAHTKAWLSRTIADALLRSTYVWTASTLLILTCTLWQPIGGDVYRSTGWLRVVHGIVQLAGLLFIALSVRSLDPLELAGIRLSSSVVGLETAGPYRLVRHPLYLGWLLLVFGASHMTGDRLAFAVMTAAYLVIGIRFEERSLVAEFGRDYERYQGSVRWRMLPFIY